MSKNYVSPSMLPMKEIAQYLELICGFGKKTDAAIDTNHVAGILSNLIAVAATDSNGELIKDRATVMNALQLGGIAANKYITTDGASALLSDSYSLSTNTGDEIKNLRDELYQIKAELVKTGMIKNTECYNGFIDPFKVGNEKYLYEPITVTNTDSSSVINNYISVEDTSNLYAGEYIVIDTNEPQIAQIQDITSSNRVDLVVSIAGPIPSGTNIYKSYGSYHNGSFVFGKQEDIAISSKEKYIILNDDIQPLILTKKYTPNSGYAAQINIPSTAKGAIRKVGIQAKVTGYPGGLKCYVIDPTNNTNDILSIATIEALKEDGKIIGESNLIYASEATQAYNELYFEFNDTIILDKSKYLFLFVQIDADNNNYWELKGLRGETNMDLQTNSKLYSFSDGVGLQAEDGDLYLVVVTSEILLDSMQYNKEGLYSAEFKLSDLTQATRVRVELKINREGRFRVIDNPNTLVPNANRLLNTYNEDNKSYSTNLFNAGDLIAIGNQIATVGTSRAANTSFSLASETYAPPGEPVYRIGYKVQAKAIKKVFNSANETNPIETQDITLVDLPLIAIIPGKESSKEDISSDRLIFEGILKENNNRLSLFNDIEIQVYWKNDLATTMEINNAPELAGSILDITVSTDNTLNSAKYNIIEDPDINALSTSNNEPITTHDESIIEVNN